MNKSSNLISTDEEKAEVLHYFFASVFTGNLSTHPSLVDGLATWGSVGQSCSHGKGRPGL